LAIAPENRNDEVKLTGSLQRIHQEDPSVSFQQNDDTHEMVLRGQGEIHLQIALEKLEGRYKIATGSSRPNVPYKETIQKSISQHGRFKRQTGGHGMFGDVHVDIQPRPRGEGFEFTNKVVGGSVPKQFIPAVENGVKEFSVRGPLGFPVVDFGVTLTDGQFHAVDSNEMSFKLAARVAMTEGMPKCAPVLLEPISRIEIDVPSEFTNKVHGLISTRRGQILGFAGKEGWTGWDTVEANMPSSELHDLIIELRSLSMGIATYRAEFDHLQELTGRLADQVIEARKEAAAAE
jgi:elongation factor G